MEATTHEHCENCFKLYCNVYNLCKMVQCEFGCSLLMHSCKMADHKAICQKIKVCCLNAGYGCPAVIPRENVKIHLEICPASVTCCTMEWNRYPIYSKSRLSWVPFFQPNPILVKGQLDVELTLRDQRVLQDLLRKRMKKGKVKVDKIRLDSDTASSRSRRKQARESASPSEREDNAIAMALALSALEEKIRIKKLNCQVITESLITDQPSSNQGSLSEDNQLEGSVKDLSTSSNEKTQLENLLVECNSEKAIELHCLQSGQGISENSDFLEQVVDQNQPIGDTIPMPPELAPMCFDHNLGLNLMIDTMPKFQKQFPIYAIPCNQVFRRNEFGSHFKNVHSDIQGGLNGWMEHRCPLAHYGCTFVRYRILPHSQDGVIVFNQDLGSFGVQFSNTDINSHCGNNSEQPMNSEIHVSENLSSGNSAEKDLLTTLPVEVLEQTANMLDGFSLCSFSCTCKVLRKAARHVLEAKGMVILEWEKKVYRTGHWRWTVRFRHFVSTSALENWSV